MFSSLEDGFNKSLGDAIFQSKNLGDSLKTLARDALEQLFLSLVKIGEQQLLQTAFGAEAQSTEVAGAVAAGAAMTAAYTPAAIAASIASFGGADIAAQAGLSATYALGNALAFASAVGKAQGGPISGPGGPTDDKVPIWASAGEYIVKASAAAANRPLLDAINNGSYSSYAGNRFANGGPISSNSHSSTIVHNDFSNAVFGGSVTREDVEQILDKGMRTVYGPAIVKQSVGQSVKTQHAISNHRTLNR